MLGTLFSSKAHLRMMMVFVFLLTVCSIPERAQEPEPVITVHQIREVSQGRDGAFEVQIAGGNKSRPITLRLRCDVGTGRAVFEDGSTEMVLQESTIISVHGIVSSDVSGGLSLTAWPEGAEEPAATAFFDVLAPTPEPRIFFDGFDVTGTRQQVTVGQRVRLTVILHPGVPVRTQRWTIGNRGDYTGGFVHTSLQGGPQPVIRDGPSTCFYWVTPGQDRTVTYRLTLTNGETASAQVTFDVYGPSSTDVQVDSVKVEVSLGAESSSLLGMTGPGISFRARYQLPEGMLKNFTWVQLIESDAVTLTQDGVVLHCVPKSEPVARVGAGLDTLYPYDTGNPTVDNPRIQLASDVPEYSRVLHARMYLLWTSRLPNSIVVPLGFVDWSFSGEVALKGGAKREQVLKSGWGGPDRPDEPFTRSQSYPFWTSLVPYTEVLTCN